MCSFFSVKAKYNQGVIAIKFSIVRLVMGA